MKKIVALLVAMLILITGCIAFAENINEEDVNDQDMIAENATLRGNGGTVLAFRFSENQERSPFHFPSAFMCT